ncbi:MAG: hypothetical protein LC748_07275 [Thermomicrobia bacterium]|nr:hypothetical protein [Thermomicrobia bacterium]
MATPVGPRGQIRDIERHEVVRERGAAAPGVKRGLNTRGLRSLKDANRPPHRFNTPSAMPLTQTGWAVVLAVVMLLALLAVIAALLVR